MSSTDAGRISQYGVASKRRRRRRVGLAAESRCAGTARSPYPRGACSSERVTGGSGLAFRVQILVDGVVRGFGRVRDRLAGGDVDQHLVDDLVLLHLRPVRSQWNEPGVGEFLGEGRTQRVVGDDRLGVGKIAAVDELLLDVA